MQASSVASKVNVKKSSAYPAPITQTTKIIVTNGERTNLKATAEPKSPDHLKDLVHKKSLTSMSDEEIIQENLKEILDKKSREERKANGRMIAVVLAFFVIFLALYHAWIRKKAALAGMLVPAGIMLSYGAWMLTLAKRDKHKRDIFERHIEEVALKNKCELEEKHNRTMKRGGDPSGSVGDNCNIATTLHFINELRPETLNEHRKKTRRNRQRNRRINSNNKNPTTEVTVHGSGTNVKRPSLKQKLFGQTIAHVKLVEMHGDSLDSELNEKRKRMQRMDTLAAPKIVRMSSAP